MSSIGASSETCAAKTTSGAAATGRPMSVVSSIVIRLATGVQAPTATRAATTKPDAVGRQDRCRHHDGNHQIAPGSELDEIAPAIPTRAAE